MIRIYVGDSRQRLRELGDQSVHTVVTSPPYFGLRDYGTGTWIGGEPDCAHRVGGQVSDTKAAGRIAHGVRPGVDASRCLDCGAARIDSQIGLEPTPDEFVAALVELFREIRRVLRDDGTVWLNLGDSYASRPNGAIGKESRLEGQFTSHDEYRRAHERRPAQQLGLTHKQLIGIPWRVAFALQADGWILRQDIIWNKTAPMPESVTDRCTKSHEHVFLLSKLPRYYFDNKAIAEPSTGWHGSTFDSGKTGEHQLGRSQPHRKRRDRIGGAKHSDLQHSTGADYETKETRNKRDVWTVASEPFTLEMCTACDEIYPAARYLKLPKIQITEDKTARQCECGRHDAWLSHFATFPPKLIEPCILAGAPPGGTVLDPFFGAGTTGLVADRLGRECVGIELNPRYVTLAEYRLRRDGGMFTEVAAE